MLEIRLGLGLGHGYGHSNLYIVLHEVVMKYISRGPIPSLIPRPVIYRIAGIFAEVNFRVSRYSCITVIIRGAEFSGNAPSSAKN